MIVSIMQPYFFPYIGYFQLIAHSDKFIIYDDVAFIKQGWINRNRIFIKDRWHYFTVPVANISSYRNIRDHWLYPRQYALWKKKLLKTLEQNYKDTPNYQVIQPIIEEVLAVNLPEDISSLSYRSIKAVCDYLQIGTMIVQTSSIYQNAHLQSQERVINICHYESADIYLNLIGGASLYDYLEFWKNGIKLMFLKPGLRSYKQQSCDFMPGLSIIDVLMNMEKKEIQDALNDSELVLPADLSKIKS